ncbi:MAG: hypothetical protein A2107_14540 [Verrucomicrobia bacterium GWF2_62_7]|nr:MAG: hypothetical protein A2107_14540 [Verrucomicrobia bacterium GWF2_62_7]
MTNWFRSTCVLSSVGLVLILAAPAAAASSALARADIPFDFLAAGKLLPAGRYTIEPAGAPSIVLIRGDGGHAALASIQPSFLSKDGTPQLVFDKSAGTPKLAGVRYSTPNSANFIGIR